MSELEKTLRAQLAEKTERLEYWQNRARAAEAELSAVEAKQEDLQWETMPSVGREQTEASPACITTFDGSFCHTTWLIERPSVGEMKLYAEPIGADALINQRLRGVDNMMREMNSMGFELAAAKAQLTEQAKESAALKAELENLRLQYVSDFGQLQDKTVAPTPPSAEADSPFLVPDGVYFEDGEAGVQQRIFEATMAGEYNMDHCLGDEYISDETTAAFAGWIACYTLSKTEKSNSSPSAEQITTTDSFVDEALEVFESAACHSTYKMREGVKAVIGYVNFSNYKVEQPDSAAPAKLKAIEYLRGRIAKLHEFQALPGAQGIGYGKQIEEYETLIRWFEDIARPHQADGAADCKSQLDEFEQDAKRYQWIRSNIKEQLTGGSAREHSLEHKTMYVLPQLIAWADFCGQISFDEAIDSEIAKASTEPQPQMVATAHRGFDFVAITDDGQIIKPSEAEPTWTPVSTRMRRAGDIQIGGEVLPEIGGEE